MSIERSYNFECCDREQVWDKLSDPDFLGGIIADGKGLKNVGKNKFNGKLPVKVGPIKGKLNTTITLEKVNKPKRFSLNVYGKWRDQRVSGKGTFTLSKNGCSTKVKYQGGLTLFMRGPLKVKIDYPGPVQVEAQNHLKTAINKLFERIEKQCCKENGDAH